jgi:hypothetical protein
MTIGGIAILSVQGVVKIPTKYWGYGILLIPVSIIVFNFATLIRQTDSQGSSFKEKIELHKQRQDDNFTPEKLSLIFYRIGFLDYATEIIVQKKAYKEIFNMKYYGQSVVDNVLSPGFDVFDVPKVANALIFVYNDKGSPSLKAIDDSNYQSDQVTAFGEFFALFGGWFSLIVFFLVGYLFQFLISFGTFYDFDFYMKKSFVLYLFYVFINSFGLDWLLFEIIGLCVTYFIVSLFTIKVKSANVQN